MRPGPKAEKLGELRRIRRDKELTQQRVADLSGVSRLTIGELELQRRGATPSTIAKIAAALEVEPDDLIGDPEGVQEERNALLRSLTRRVDYMAIRTRDELLRVLDGRDSLGLEVLRAESSLAVIGAYCILRDDDEAGRLRPTEEARRIRVEAQRAVSRLDDVVGEVETARVVEEEEPEPDPLVQKMVALRA